jgi:hypothetical protein
MNHAGFVSMVTRCNPMEYASKSAASRLISRAGAPASEYLADHVGNQIIDFINGKTHGEKLLHALYDHILDEPIPERIRSLFKE